jgi:L-fuculose-phosphate aldolase
VTHDDIVAAARTLVRERLTVGTSGNVSARHAGRIWITPSGVDPAAMAATDIVEVDAAGSRLGESPHAPSSEVGFHVGIYGARADIGAVVHTHSPWATAVSCTRQAMPPFHYMMVGTGDGTLECAPYHPPGSPGLAHGVVTALGGRAACLLANHGVVATGRDLDAALRMAREVEMLAQQYCLTRLAGEPKLLDSGQVAELIEIFQAYGQQQEDE